MGPSQFLITLILTTLSPIFTSSSDHTTLVFKGCADQNFQDFNSLYKPTLQNLLQTLTSHSSSTKFFNTTSGDITGLFQCRGDLSNDDCYNCVKRTPSLSSKLCKQAIAARVQLNGCYLEYQIAGFRQPGATELLYKVCGSNRASGDGFEDRLNSALGEIVKGVVNGFYAGEYESIFVLGQCEGDLSSGDCVNCVRNAVESVKTECGSSILGQVYLQDCYISYTYYPSGVPANQETIASSSGKGSGRNTQKTIALVLGGLVGVGLVMACLLFTKSALKKKSRSYKYGG